MIAIIGTSDRPCWLAEACKILLLQCALTHASICYTCIRDPMQFFMQLLVQWGNRPDSLRRFFQPRRGGPCSNTINQCTVKQSCRSFILVYDAGLPRCQLLTDKQACAVRAMREASLRNVSATLCNSE